MNIAILLPYKENYSKNFAGAVSIFVNDTNKLSKFYKTIIDNTISNDELYEEWMSLSNDDKIKNIISAANKDISQFHKQKKLKKEYFEFWKLIHKSVTEISNFKVKEFNN